MSDSISSTEAVSARSARLRALYRTFFLCREIEETERRIIARGEAHFHIASAGHEANAALAEFLQPQDWLNCHYRDRALMLARGLQPKAFFDALYANADSNSAGRHMNVMFSSRALNIVSMPVSVTNNALPAVGIAAQVKEDAKAPVVYCSVGDGGTQQGDFYEAVSEAVRSSLPVFFLIQDNRYALSTPTQRSTFYALDPSAGSFLGLPLHRMDGRDPLACREAFGELVGTVRSERKPVLAIMDCERLGSHSNADDQTKYRAADELERNNLTGDPLPVMRAVLLEEGFEEAEIAALEEACLAEVKEAAVQSRTAPAPVLDPDCRAAYPEEWRGLNEYTGGEATELNMRLAMRDTLDAAMAENPAISLYGEDIEDPKGDVFGVSEGLSTKYPGRVVNSPLAEATIMGASLGRALAGGRPVAFIQFADFLPLIYNIYHNELASMFWRSNGEWSCPVVLMVSCGGYRPGTGPHHTQTMEALLAHTPGVDIVMPSTAGDAAGLLNAALKSPRPTVVLYPKNLINNTQRATTRDVSTHWVQPGRAEVVRHGSDVTLAAWGNTVPVCEEAAAQLTTLGVDAEVIDLRSISPWDEVAVTVSAERTGHLLTVHEDNLFCGVGAEICAQVAERAKRPVRVKRLARADTFTPFNMQNQLELLPSVKTTVQAACELLGMEIDWVREASGEADIELVSAQGVGASDDTVTLVEWAVKRGQAVKADQLLAVVEADKAAAEMLSASEGVVDDLLIEEGDAVQVGTPILKLRVTPELNGEATPAATGALKPVLIKDRVSEEVVPVAGATAGTICLSGLSTVSGNDVVGNEFFLARHNGRTSDDIVSQTGIRNRQWADSGQNLLNMAVQATRTLLEETGHAMRDIDFVVCATTTPDMATPSLACRVLHALDPEHECPAFDLSAACSGYIYALRSAYDYMRHRPGSRALVITSEVMSRVLDEDDYDTTILFGDGASATLLESLENPASGMLTLDEPLISAKGEPGDYLKVPLANSHEKVSMAGRKIFQMAVRKMAEVLNAACERDGLTLNDLDVIIPHQANDRILKALARRLKFDENKVWANIMNLGNTSSSSIPLCLKENWVKLEAGSKVALVAFGGGYTFAASIMKVE